MTGSKRGPARGQVLSSLPYTNRQLSGYNSGRRLSRLMRKKRHRSRRQGIYVRYSGTPFHDLLESNPMCRPSYHPQNRWADRDCESMARTIHQAKFEPRTIKCVDLTANSQAMFSSLNLRVEVPLIYLADISESGCSFIPLRTSESSAVATPSPRLHNPSPRFHSNLEVSPAQVLSSSARLMNIRDSRVRPI